LLSGPVRAARPERPAAVRRRRSGAGDRQVAAHRGRQAVEQRLADQCMADGHLGDPRNGLEQRPQVALVEVVSGIDAQSCRTRGLGRGPAIGQCRLHPPARREGLGIGAGVDLDAVGTERGSGLEPGGPGVDEQADPAAQLTEGGDDRPQARGVACQVEAVVGGQLAVGIRHEGDLGRTRLAGQLQQARIARPPRRERVAFDVELHGPVLRGDQRRQRGDVIVADMAAVRPRVHRQAPATLFQAHAGGGQRIGQPAAARISQHGHLVEVDTEHGHRRASTFGGRAA